jgi:hypothetical protein
MCFRDRWDGWRTRCNVVVATSTRDTFQEMFDDDDTLAYEPSTTAAVIMCGGDEEAEAAALEVRFPLLHCETLHSLAACWCSPTAVHALSHWQALRRFARRLR